MELKAQTRIVPVHQPSSKFFVPVAKPREISVGDRGIKTAPLLFGQRVSYIGLGTTEELLKAGIADQTDMVSPDARLESVCLWLPQQNKYLSAAVSRNAGHLFAEVNGSRRRLSLDMATVLSFKVNSETKDYCDERLGLELIGAEGTKVDELQFQMRLHLAGSLQIETGEVSVDIVDVSNVITLDNSTKMAMDQTRYADQFILMGYELAIYRQNTNRQPVSA